MPSACRTRPPQSSGRPGAPAQTAPAPVAYGLRTPQKGPALLAAADENRGSQAPIAAEDLEALEIAARHGDRDAQFRIGTRFLNDGGLDGGPAAAARWFAKAAAQGHNEAQFMLASMYERGAGVEKDEARAIELYRQAASAGHVRSMHNLGAMLLKNATAQSYREAAAWFEQAAAKGFADSQYNLALLYEHGLGIEQDLLRAYQWYVEAAKAGLKEAAVQAERIRRTLPSAQNVTRGGGGQVSLVRLLAARDREREEKRGGAKGAPHANLTQAAADEAGSTPNARSALAKILNSQVSVSCHLGSVWFHILVIKEGYACLNLNREAQGRACR